MAKQNQTMLEGALLPNIISYTIPIILTSILQLLFNAADLVVVGRFCGSLSVAAVGATGSITYLMVNFFIGLSIGAGVAVAHGIGSKEDEMVRNTVHTAIPMALISGMVLTVIGIAFSGYFLKLMGTPDTVLPLSAVYMKIYFAGITFTMVYNFCAAILRAVGDTRSPLVFLTLSGIINVVLNVIFVTLLDLNVAGVALATTISQGISAALVVWALMKRTDACRFVPKDMGFHRIQVAKIIRIGLPAGIQSSLFSISNVLIQSSINSFGDVFMSGSAASANIEGFVYVSLNAFHQTAVNFIGQNSGAKQFQRVRRIFLLCLICVAVVGIGLGTLVWAVGPQLLSVYIPDSPEAVSYGMIRLSYICLPYFICGLMDVTTGSLRGLGASFVPMLISVLGVVGIRAGWIFTIFQLPGFHTPQCLFSSYTISWFITFLCQLTAFVLIYRKLTRSQN